MRRRLLRRWWPRRTRRRVITVALPVSLLALTILLVVLMAPITGDGDTPDSAPDAVTLPAVFRRDDPHSLTQARVLRVIDGDTIDVALEGEVERIRYYGIDAPERNQPCYDEARRRNRELVGEDVFLMADLRERDQHGRLLRYVFTSEGVLVDASLVAEGYGVAWREDGAYREALVNLEAETRELDVGCLWGKG